VAAIPPERAPAEASRSTPPETVTPPVKLLVPERVCRPAPVFTRPPAPESTPE